MEFRTKNEIKNAIRQQITTKDVQAIKAMLRIYEYQTEGERFDGTVRNNNGVGFVSADAGILTSFCKQYEKTGRLSDKQLVLLKKKVGKYAGQLCEQAIEKGLYVKENNVWKTC